MKHKLTTILMMQGFVKIASLKRSALAATIMLAAVFAAQAATYTVTNADDSGAGSLRDAINQANASIDNDTIIFAPGANGTITLASALPNLANNGSLTITGNGASNTIISGNNAVRPFQVNNGAVATFNGLTVTNGNSAGDGGGMFIGVATVTITNSVFRNNSASIGGGAISNSGNLTVTDSTLSGNTAGRGGAFILYNSAATVTNTTISGNTASFGAGAISNFSFGGGSGSLLLNSCTITNNTGISTGGVSAFDNGGSAGVTTALKNTIVANNSNPQLSQSGAVSSPNSRIISQGYNLTSDNGSGLLTGMGDQINTDPRLAPLADNDGLTMTHALLIGSPAIDKGFNAGTSTTDQRGTPYERTFDFPNIAPAPGGDNTDIGAFELRAFTVTKTADTNDGACDADCSLREAIMAANASAANDTIIFAPEANGTITLSSALPNLTNNGNLTITGNGASNTIISGNGVFRPFEINGGANVMFNRLTVTQGFTGSASNGGGGIRVNGGATVTVADSIVSNNVTDASGGGGGIINLGSLTIVRSSISGNMATNASGGGIRSLGTLTISDSLINGNNGDQFTSALASQDSMAILTNTTISGNGLIRAATAIMNFAVSQAANLTLNNCTVTGNNGAGVTTFRHPSGTTSTTTLKNSIIANNTSTQQLRFGGANATYVSQGYNLTSDNGSGFLTGTGDQINTNPLLAPLADNGGTTLTHAPRCGSPTIDAGQNSGGSSGDQRGAGFARTVDLSAFNVGDGTDIGALEAQIEPDCSAPVITPNVSGTLGDNGWYKSDVQVSWSVSDDESSVSSQTGCDTQTVTADTSGVTFTCWATSAGGTASNSVTVKRDTTNPVISFVSRTAANSSGWNNTNVTVNWSCSDTLSGAVNATVSQTVSTEGLNQSSTGTCQDSAGNAASNTQTGISIDKTAPTLAPTVSPNPVLLNGTATATPNATDALSGIASQSCGAVNTTSVGFKTVACTATDLAGNTANANANYQVAYNFAGFFQPVENLPTINIVNAGQSIPIKFSLSGYQGLNIIAAGYPISSPVACDASQPGSTIDPTVNPGGSSLSYSTTTDQYSYVWKTDKAWKGTCRIFVLRLTDGSEHYAKFRFR